MKTKKRQTPAQAAHMAKMRAAAQAKRDAALIEEMIADPIEFVEGTGRVSINGLTTAIDPERVRAYTAGEHGAADLKIQESHTETFLLGGDVHPDDFDPTKRGLPKEVAIAVLGALHSTYDGALKLIPTDFTGSDGKVYSGARKEDGSVVVTCAAQEYVVDAQKNKLYHLNKELRLANDRALSYQAALDKQTAAGAPWEALDSLRCSVMKYERDAKVTQDKIDECHRLAPSIKKDSLNQAADSLEGKTAIKQAELDRRRLQILQREKDCESKVWMREGTPVNGPDDKDLSFFAANNTAIEGLAAEIAAMTQETEKKRAQASLLPALEQTVVTVFSPGDLVSFTV